MNPLATQAVATTAVGKWMRRWRRWRLAIAIVSAIGAGWVGVALVVVLAVAAVLASAPTQATAQATGIPPVVLSAYLNAERNAATVAEGCVVRWPIVAGIWRVESHHATYGGRTTGPDGTVTPPLFGVTLDGSTPGTQVIADTDQGVLDGDGVWDRAVGPAQFLPSSWRALGQDGNGDGVADPQNVFDAALATVAHLCVWAPGDYTQRPDLQAALYRYNRRDQYVTAVMGWIEYYDTFRLVHGDVVAGGLYTFPLPHDSVTLAQVRGTHHDYPASDLGVPEGTPVYAAHPGQVSGISRPVPGGRCGYGVHIEGHDQHRYTYCHGSALPTNIDAGVEVVAGQVVMWSGNTGNSTGPHLHFQIRNPAGDLVCPQPLLEAWWDGVALSPAAAPTTGCTH